MAVLQEKSIIEAIETLTSNSQQSELYVGQHFISWPSAIAYVSEWCNLQGFQSRLDRSDRNNNMPAGEYRKLAIVCQHSGKYKKPLAELSLNNNIKENHKTIAKVSKTIRLGCKAHINLSRLEKNNVNQYVFVTTIVNEHCHELNSQLINYTKETALTREMIEDIKFLTLQVRLTITQQRVYLEKKYPERKIQSDILRYEIQKYRPSAKELNRDALNLYEHLLKLKKMILDGKFLSILMKQRNSLSQERFEQLFTILIEKYEQAAEYLRNLYKTKTYWALCFTSTIFTAAVQSTSRVEGMNAVLKREILNSNTSLLQLAEVIHRRHKEEEKQKEFAFWKTVIPCVVDLQTASFLFPAIEALIKKYLTTPLYNLQVQEINQSVYYKCEQFELNQIDMFEQISEVIDTGFLEDLPDERKACIKSIFYHVNQREIKEIWAMFHIQLIRPRWYKNRDLDGKHEPFVFAAKFQDTELLKQPEINQEIFYLTALIQNNVDKWEQISKSTLDEKLFFGKVMGMAKKVTLKADELNSEIDTDDEANENSLQLQNPIKKPRKGRPKGTTRIKSAMEPPKSNRSQRHCKICRQAGHYSSTCTQNQK
ncbi:unnamed protein product [Rhizophagus irregularis]|uniref:Uncharacterized protein n=2 Tax=Rhizophagus irregularis TaxID=588596 RepID=A0A915YRT5_9GLOM|nr:unnamed protein product [Rhizophagus irregularis]